MKFGNRDRPNNFTPYPVNENVNETHNDSIIESSSTTETNPVESVIPSAIYGANPFQTSGANRSHSNIDGLKLSEFSKRLRFFGAVLFITLFTTTAILISSLRPSLEPEFVALAVLFPSIILHEISHGFTALLFGDDTAKKAGRLTLNPVSHIDLVGTIIVPILTSLSGLGVFGWAKPVPVNFSRISNRNKSFLVSLAGPVTNIFIAVIAGLLIHFFAVQTIFQNDFLGDGMTSQPLWTQALILLGAINLLLATLNLLPIPPLDGSSIIERFLPKSKLPAYFKFRSKSIGIAILALIVFRSQFSSLIVKIINVWVSIVLK